MDRTFSVDEARTMLAGLLDDANRLVELRAELIAAAVARQRGDETIALADLKALEATVAEILDGFRSQGVVVKGYAPLLLDFPSRLDGRDVLLCWLEGEHALEWYHDVEHGFAGRRRLSAQ